MPKSRLVGNIASDGISVSFAMNASEVPLSVVWNAVEGKTGKLLAGEKVWPVMNALGGFAASSAMANPCSWVGPFPPKNVEYSKSAEPLPPGLILVKNPFPAVEGRAGSKAPGVTGKFAEIVVPTT